MTRTRSPLLALFACLLATAAAAVEPTLVEPTPAEPPLPDMHAMGPVAIVGASRIMPAEVFELWTPIWSETLAKVRNGKLSPAEGDRKLAEEWNRAIKALVKDELFYQEAEQEHAAVINMYVDQVMRQGAEGSRQQVRSMIRREMEQGMEKEFRRLNANVVKESGGAVKLHKVLQGRGLTLSEWQARLRKKAFTNYYLYMVLKPRTPDPGPRRIQEYYQKHTEEFAMPGLVRFRHIYFSNSKRGEDQARDDAIEVWERLMDNEITFEEAAAQYSDDEPSKRRGGLESGEEASDPEREAWLGDVRSALKDETPGEVAPIMESAFGCHIAVLLSVGAERKKPFNEVKREIEQKISSELWEAETDRYFASIRKNTEIQVVMPTFPSYLSCAAQAAIPGGPAVYQIGGTHKPEIRASRPSPRRRER